jgi:hypothetical protein
MSLYGCRPFGGGSFFVTGLAGCFQHVGRHLSATERPIPRHLLRDGVSDHPGWFCRSESRISKIRCQKANEHAGGGQHLERRQSSH